jgi:hypothetical protein
MPTTTGVFLPDEPEQKLPKKSPQSVQAKEDAGVVVQTVKPDHADPAKLSEQQLKTALKAAWKKHEELAKEDMAPLLYWLREKLRAQGSRNDIHDKDRGFGAWVEEHLDFSRRTADRWCEWYAVTTGLKPASTFGPLSKSDVELYGL